MPNAANPREAYMNGLRRKMGTVTRMLLVNKWERFMDNSVKYTNLISCNEYASIIP
ncbi:hypothetical protein GPUN_0997 [Glaciecola punicea ACAM 611]|uniref:Uncharacterized protein n=1 Tax=Glaciecola punicea ACAM 611 TaxID=1121923 RepID=H5TA01_9ALTE|nr:hypothetical protein GPUN_0997 [Glaciecola punicea ACAM 611]